VAHRRGAGQRSDVMRFAFLSCIWFAGRNAKLGVQWRSGCPLSAYRDRDRLCGNREIQPTTFPGVPTRFNAIRMNPDANKHDLCSIRVCLSGAASLPLEVQTLFERLISGKLIEGYGLTETAPVAVSNPIGGMREPGSVGMPLPDADVKIVDLEDPNKEMPVGEVGGSGHQRSSGIPRLLEAAGRVGQGVVRWLVYYLHADHCLWQ
jgi:acyl-CoA synthetase (AMP-forming)/AMP-acid ligase II